MMQELSLFQDDELMQCSPLKGRNVCILGSMRQPARKVQQFFAAHGAECRASTKVSRNVHYILLGDGAPADQVEYIRTLGFHGYHPRVIRQKELDDMMQGHFSPYFVPEAIAKELHLSYGHYERSHLVYGDAGNPLYTRELFVPSDTRTPQDELYQKLGDHGIYANSYIDDTTDVIVLSDLTLERLKAGETDATIRTIEKAYDESRSQTFRFVLTSEHELLGWLQTLS